MAGADAEERSSDEGSDEGEDSPRICLDANLEEEEEADPEPEVIVIDEIPQTRTTPPRATTEAQESTERLSDQFEALRIAVAGKLNLAVKQELRKTGLTSAYDEAREDQAEVQYTGLPTSMCVRRAAEAVNCQIRGVKTFVCQRTYVREDFLKECPKGIAPHITIPQAPQFATKSRGAAFMPHDIAIQPGDREGSTISAVENDCRIGLGALSFMENTIGAIMAESRAAEAKNGPSALTDLIKLAKVPLTQVTTQAAYHLTRATANSVLIRREGQKYRKEILTRMTHLPWDMADARDMAPVLTDTAAAEAREDVIRRSVLELAKMPTQQPRYQRQQQTSYKRTWPQTEGRFQKKKPAEAQGKQPEKQKSTPSEKSYKEYKEYKNTRGGRRGRGGRGRGGRGAGHKGASGAKQGL